MTTVSVLLGLFLRARGYFWQVPAFWLDECSWAMMLVEKPLLELAIRPIGFMAVSRFLAQTFSLSEPVLRAMPWLAGLATLLMAAPLARRLFKNPAARLLFVFVIALHPCAIDFSKEYKPYSVSLALHTALMLTTLLYYESGRAKDLAWVLGVAVLGGPFAQDLVFAYPGVYLLAGYRAWRGHREHLRPIVATAGVILLLLVLQYLFIWRVMPATEANEWGVKYNVFYTGDKQQGFASWWLERQSDMVAFPGFRRRFWHPESLKVDVVDQLRLFDRAIWILLGLVGLVVIAIRRRNRALLLVLPLGTLALFNALDFWPLGVFRANVFTLVYSAAIACIGLDLPERATAKIADAIPALALVFAPLALFDRSWNDHKQALTYTSDFPNAIRRLIDVKLGADPKSKQPLLLDRRSCDPFRFYTQFHPSASNKLRRTIRSQFDVRCISDERLYRPALIGALPREPHHVWTILHTAKPVVRMLRHSQLGLAQLTYQERVGPHTLMAFWAPKVAPPAPPQPPPKAADDEAAEPQEDSPDG